MAKQLEERTPIIISEREERWAVNSDIDVNDINVFGEGLDQFAYSRMETLCPSRDPDYAKFGDEATRLYKEILPILGDQSKLIRDYEAAKVAELAITVHEAYMLGLGDGVRFCLKMGLIAK